MKQLEPDPWVDVANKYEIGQVIEGQITRIVPFGAFIQIESSLEGLIHISELSENHVSKVEDVVGIGDTVKAKIIKLIPDEQKIGLSLKGTSEEDVPVQNEAQAETEAPAETTDAVAEPTVKEELEAELNADSISTDNAAEEVDDTASVEAPQEIEAPDAPSEGADLTAETEQPAQEETQTEAILEENTEKALN